MLKTGVLALLLVAFAPAPGRSEVDIRPWTSGATPKLVLTDLQGRGFDLATQTGRVVVVNFWATWCDPCREEMPSLQRLREKLSGRPFELVTVNFGESKERAGGFISRLGLTIPVLLDPEKRVAENWKVKGLPMTFIVDASGKIRYWSYGEHDWSDGEAYGLVAKLVAEAGGAGR